MGGSAILNRSAYTGLGVSALTGVGAYRGYGAYPYGGVGLGYSSLGYGGYGYGAGGYGAGLGYGAYNWRQSLVPRVGVTTTKTVEKS